jgi:hypothetical protein
MKTSVSFFKSAWNALFDERKAAVGVCILLLDAMAGTSVLSGCASAGRGRVGDGALIPGSGRDLVVPLVGAAEPLQEIKLAGDPLGVAIAEDHVGAVGAVIVARVRIVLVLAARVCA